MFQSLPFYIGLRYLRAKRRNNFISFISGVSMIGLTLGVMVLIIVLSVMNGFDRELRTRILGMVPHVKIYNPGEIRNSKEIIDFATQHPDVIGASVFVETQGMIVGSSRTKGSLITGIDPATISDVSILPDHLTEGRIELLEESEFGIILGDNLAKSLGVSTGEKVTMIVPKMSVNIASIQPRFKRFTVVGIFKVGAELDGSLAITHYKDLAKLLMHSGSVDGVQVRTNNLFKARQIGIDIRQSLLENDLNKNQFGSYYVSDWTRTQGNLFEAIQLEKRLVGLLLFMIVAVAVFNIVSSLVMVVTDKQGEIAVLRTLGATSRQIMGVFMVQGTAIGIIGIGSGVLLGVIGAQSIESIVSWIEHIFGIQFLNADVYFVSKIPSELRWDDVITIASATFFISVISTIYPAWKAASILPAEVLRYES